MGLVIRAKIVYTVTTTRERELKIMTSMTYTMNKSYTFDPAHKGAHYTFDGVKFCNFGEFAEVMLKACMGFESKKDANTPYDKGSDIPELSASVKSSKATLVNKPLGQDFESFKRTYFESVHSTTFIWVSVHGEELTAYLMNKSEFSTFVDTFAGFDNSRKVIRFKTESGAMIRWLEERL